MSGICVMIIVEVLLLDIVVREIRGNRTCD